MGPMIHLENAKRRLIERMARLATAWQMKPVCQFNAPVCVNPLGLSSKYAFHTHSILTGTFYGEKKY